MESCPIRFHNKVDLRPTADQNFDGTLNLSVYIRRQKFFVDWVRESELDVSDKQNETSFLIKLKRLNSNYV